MYCRLPVNGAAYSACVLAHFYAVKKLTIADFGHYPAAGSETCSKYPWMN